MQIIEEIRKNELVSNPSEIQKICHDKLKLNPLPNVKSELCRLSDKSKFSNFLNYSHKKKESKVIFPFKKASQNTIRIIIGENSSFNFEEQNYSIRKLTKRQGRILIRLIDREANRTSFEIIKDFRNI